MHKAIVAHPEALPNEDFKLGPLVALTDEFDPMAASEGFIDLLASDATGRLAIVEFKKSSENPDVREVIAQLLDYGSALGRLPYARLEERWRVRAKLDSDLVSHAEQRFEQIKVDFEPETFRLGIESCLEEGDFSFFYVARDLDERTRRIMTYLAEGPRMRFFGVEVDRYHDPATKRSVLIPKAAFIPSWINAPPGGGETPIPLSEDADAQRLVTLLDSLVSRLGLVTADQHRGGFLTGRRYDPPRKEHITSTTTGIGVYTSSRGTEFNLQVLRETGRKAEADELLEHLCKVSGVNVTAANWPNVASKDLAGKPGTEDLFEEYFTARAKAADDEDAESLGAAAPTKPIPEIGAGGGPSL